MHYSLLFILFTLLFMSGILQRYCTHHNTFHITVRVRNPTKILFMPLCISEHCSRHCARQESYRHIVHVTVRGRTLLTSLCASKHCSCHCACRTFFTYCSCYCRSIFNRKNCWCTIHGIVHTISTAKTVDALFMNMWMRSRLLKLLVQWKSSDLSLATKL